jgi:hypothetical protein
MSPTLAVVVVATAAGLGLLLRPWLWPWTAGAGIAAHLLFLASLIGFCVALSGARQRPAREDRVPYAPLAGGLLLCGVFVMVVWAIGGHTGNVLTPDATASRRVPSWLDRNVPWIHLSYAAMVATKLCSSLWPTQRLLRTFAEWQGAERQVAQSAQWVADCREWIARGVPSPLAEAESALAQWTERARAARERLDAEGYRARFRHPAKETAA